MSTTTCTSCGSALTPGDTFCAVCAAPVVEPRPAAPTVPSAPSMPVGNARPSSAAQHADHVDTARTVPPEDSFDYVSLSGELLGPRSTGARPAGTGEVPPVSRGDRAHDGGPISGSIAPVAPRVWAFLIDQATIGIPVAILYGIAVLAARGAAADVAPGDEGSALAGISGLFLLPGLVSLAGSVWLWIWEGRTGKSPGNLLLGIRTVSATTLSPAGVLPILVRRLVEGLGAIACLVGTYVVVASAAWDSGPRRQGWHDKIAGTLVLYVVGGEPAPVAAPARHGAAAVLAPASAPASGSASISATSSPVPAASFAAPAPSVGGAPVISAVPGFSRPPTATGSVPSAPPPPPRFPQPQPEPQSEPQSVTVVFAADDVPEEDEIDRTRLSVTRRASLPVLVLPTGDRLTVTGPGVLGRNPSAPRGQECAHVVAITDSTRTVSKTHLGFGVDSVGLWVSDLHSTNGTAVLAADGIRTQLAAGVTVHVSAGESVVVGDVRLEVAE